LGLRKDLEIIVNDLDSRQALLRNDMDDLFVFNISETKISNSTQLGSEESLRLLKKI